MAATKKFFEQIPVETVKRIAMEFPAEIGIGNDVATAEIPAEVRSPHQSWRELALKVQHEQDPERMTELAEQLIAALDREKRGEPLPRKLDVENRSE